MENENFAAIDIGSNGARLLIKNVNEDSVGNYEFSKVLFLRIPLRLGKDVFTFGKVSKERERMMMCMMKSFKQLMKLYRVKSYRAYATSAMRDAENGKKIIKKIKKDTGIELEIIAGNMEAKLLYNNAIESTDVMGGNYAYMDVGGGSTEITMMSYGKKVGSSSYNVGTLRMLCGAVEEGTIERLKNDMAEYAQKYKDITIIGSGGNINKLCDLYSKTERGHKDILPVANLVKLHTDLKPLSLKDRMEKYDLKSDRADVIVPAAELFMIVAESLDSKKILVPNISLADSIIDGLYRDGEKQRKGCSEKK